MPRPTKYYTKAAKNFLDLNWEDQIYKDPNLQYNEIWPMLGFDSYLSGLKMCKRNFGYTFEQFFKHCRVADVKQYLAQPESRDQEMSEIALKFGHKSRRYFNTRFKDITGITPTEFRFFHKHFVITTGMTLAEYEQPKTKIYVPNDGNPTFLSNYLNKHAGNVLKHSKE